MARARVIMCVQESKSVLSRDADNITGTVAFVSLGQSYDLNKQDGRRQVSKFDQVLDQTKALS